MGTVFSSTLDTPDRFTYHPRHGDVYSGGSHRRLPAQNGDCRDVTLIPWDAATLIFGKTVTYVLGKIGCYKKQSEANCWKEVAQREAPQAYFDCGIAATIKSRDNLNLPHYKEQLLAWEAKCQMSTAALQQKEAKCKLHGQ